MKKHLLLVAVLVTLSITIRAQYVTIPDSNFVKFLQQKYPTCMNGNQMDTTCAAVVNEDTILCESKQIADLSGISYFDKLKELRCGLNQLSSLPALPASLTSLTCYYNQLSSLPVLPASLTQLACYYNQLTSLPALPASLRELWCHSNKLTSLPPLPALTALACSYNQLSNLPALPVFLRDLSCKNNQLSSLPPLPASLTTLRCDSNQLNSLPALPGSLYYFDISNNPGLTCMPVLKKFTGLAFFFSISGTSIRCLPNVIEHTGSIPAIDTMPICDLFNNPNGCDIGWNIQGHLYNDNNADCQWQGLETKLNAAVKMNLYLGSNLLQSVFVSGGTYSFDTDLSTYRVEVDTTGLPFMGTCQNDTTLTLNAADSVKYNINFGTSCKPGFDIGTKSIFGNLFRPANNTVVNIAAGDMSAAYGLSCAAGIGGTVALTISGPVQFVGQMNYSAIPSTIAGNVITWNVGDFAGWNFDSAFHIIVSTDTFAQMGQQVCFKVDVTPTAGDINGSNNSLTQCFDIRTSYDPNDKQVYPSGNTDTSTTWLTYTVRFQNTGNDTAIHIYIMDTLDNNLDISTFDLLSSSHKNLTQLQGNIVRFNFPSIMLPDSNVNEPLSHGYVQYRVKLKENLPLGTKIENTAYIYFDFNPPVVTNTTVNTLAVNLPTGIETVNVGEKGVILVYPNPTLGSWQLAVGEEWIGSEVSIYDVNGKLVFNSKLETQNTELSLALSPGMYLLRISSENSSVVRRLVKM